MNALPHTDVHEEGLSRESNVIDSAPDPFWPRLSRAVALLAVAIAAHVWLIRSPDPGQTPFGVISSAVLATTSTLPPVPLQPSVALIRSLASAQRARTPIGGDEDHEDRVRIAVEEVVAVGTTGVVRPPERFPEPAPSTLVSTDAPVIDRLTDAAEPAPIAAAAPPSRAEYPEVVAAPLSEIRAPARATLVTAAATVRPGTPAPPPRADPAIDKRKQEQIVLAVLQEYKRAYEQLDVRAAKAVYPSLDDRALSKAFHQIQEQRFRFAECGVSISGHDANARCTGNASYRPKVGSRVVRFEETEWTFSLARDEGGWQILNARVQ